MKDRILATAAVLFMAGATAQIMSSFLPKKLHLSGPKAEVDPLVCGADFAPREIARCDNVEMENSAHERSNSGDGGRCCSWLAPRPRRRNAR